MLVALDIGTTIYRLILEVRARDAITENNDNLAAAALRLGWPKTEGKPMKIRQAGPSMYEIRDSGSTIGHIWKHPEGWRAKIGAHEAMAATPEDAATAVYAEVTGQDIADIPKNNPGFLEMKDTKRYIYRVLDWLADNAQNNDGQLQFRRSDLNRVVTQANPQDMHRVLGNVTSLIDLACFMTDLPSIGCSASDGPYPDAWQDFPIPRMIARATAHRWSAADFERLRHEIQTFKVWRSSKAWDDATAKLGYAKIQEWASD